MKRSPEKAKDKEFGHRKPGHPAHEEWLIDESIEETFPASDPIAPATEPAEKPKKSKRQV